MNSTTTATTTDVIRRFNSAFLQHDPEALTGLIGEHCVTEGIRPAPDGSRFVGRADCLAFWQEMANDRNTTWEVEDVSVGDERAVIRWRARFGTDDGNAVRGVSLMQVRDGQVIEALGYAKTP